MDNLKKIEKLERRIAVLIQKLEHISKEISDLIKKSHKKPLRKKQSWHLKKLHKVHTFYCSEIQRISTEIVGLRNELDGGYNSETNPIRKHTIE